MMLHTSVLVPALRAGDSSDGRNMLLDYLLCSNARASVTFQEDFQTDFLTRPVMS
jgi:hypothetical protein